MEFEQIVNQVREVLAVDANTDLAGAVVQLKTELEGLRSIKETLTKAQEKVTELTPLAEDGRAYRSDLVNEAMVQGVRAFGEKFAKELYADILGRSSLVAIKQLSADWQTIGDSRLAGGRQSVDKGEQAPGEDKTTATQRIPSAAYKA